MHVLQPRPEALAQVPTGEVITLAPLLAILLLKSEISTTVSSSRSAPCRRSSKVRAPCPSAAFRFDDGVAMAKSYFSGISPVSAIFLNRVTFADTRVNGGALTNGWLEMRVSNGSAPSHMVQLTRLIFDDAGVTCPARSRCCWCVARCRR
jgi:hypothetical protein